MNKDEFKSKIETMDIYNREEYDNIVSTLKHNICQNMRIARKLSKLEPEKAALLLDLEPQSLRRIEALNDRDEFSTKVLIMAIMVYEPSADFYFKKWEENESLLKEQH